MAPGSGKVDVAAGPDLRSHLPALDGLRGLAIALVLLVHGWILPVDSRLSDYARRIVEAGWVGVDIFFVLSGFLITGGLWDAKGSPHYFRSFFGRRVIRVFPLYYLVLALALFVLPAVGLNLFLVDADDVRRQAWLWLYLSNFAMVFGGRYSMPLDVTWALAVEQHFYLVWPVVVWALSRRALMGVCVGLLLATPLVRLGLVLGGAPPNAAYFLTFGRMDALAAGALAALWARGPGGLPALRRPALVASIAGLAGLAAVVAWHRRLHYEDALTQVVGFSAVALLVAALIVRLAGLGPSAAERRVWCSPVLSSLGRYSYAIYLFHVPVQVLLTDYLPCRRQHLSAALGSPWAAQLAFHALVFSLSFALGWVSWRLFERHFLPLRRFFRYD